MAIGVFIIGKSISNFLGDSKQAEASRPRIFLPEIRLKASDNLFKLSVSTKLIFSHRQNQNRFDFVNPINRDFGTFFGQPIVPSVGRCLLLLLRIRSAHLPILGFPIADAY